MLSLTTICFCSFATFMLQLKVPPNGRWVLLYAFSPHPPKTNYSDGVGHPMTVFSLNKSFTNASVISSINSLLIMRFKSLLLKMHWKTYFAAKYNNLYDLTDHNIPRMEGNCLILNYCKLCVLIFKVQLQANILSVDINWMDVEHWSKKVHKRVNLVLKAINLNQDIDFVILY